MNRAPVHSASARGGHRRRPVRKRRLRVIGLTVLVLTVLALGAAVWVGLRGLAAKDHLEAAQSGITELKRQALALDMPAAAVTLDAVKHDTEEAESLMGDPIWRLGEHLPLVGKNLRVARELAAVANDVVANVAAPLVDVAKTVDPKALIKDGAIDVELIKRAVPAVARASSGLADAQTQMKRIDARGTISQLQAATAKIAELLDSATPMVTSVNGALPLLPNMLGAETKRTYVIVFQNPAEARALGGTALSFAEIVVDKGKIELKRVVPAGLANFPRYVKSVVPLPAGIETVFPWPEFGTFIANATLRPDFATTAQIVEKNWQDVNGFKPDGVISLDPVALGYILGSTSPITLKDGQVVDSENLVALLLNGVYLKYNSGNYLNDNLAQNAVYGEVVGATFGRFTSGDIDPKRFALALMKGVAERRVLLWSPDPAEQKQYEDFDMTGSLPHSDAKEEQVGVYFQDAVGSKLNYYLKQSVRVETGACVVEGGTARRISVDLTNPIKAPSQLSPSILGGYKDLKLRPGAQRLAVLLYAPPGSTIRQVRVDGNPVSVASAHDTEYPVAKVFVVVGLNSTLNITFDYTSPNTGAVVKPIITPLVNPTPVTQSALDCSSVK